MPDDVPPCGVDLGTRVKLRLTGPDRERYLNGQVTNDVRRATADSALYACVTNAKGKLEADIYLSATPDGEALLIDGPAELREKLPVRLDRYLIADDAEWEDVSDGLGIVHGWGPSPDGEGLWIREANRFGIPGWDAIAPADTLRLEALRLAPATDAFLAGMRIRHGFAAWGSELNEDVLPQEAVLEDRALDFNKGCYIGQEVISRIKSVGKVNRRLVVCATEDQIDLPIGTEVMVEEKTVGQITSSIYDKALGLTLALAYVKKGFNEPGQHLRTSDGKNNLSSILEIRETPVS